MRNTYRRSCSRSSGARAQRSTGWRRGWRWLLRGPLSATPAVSSKCSSPRRREPRTKPRSRWQHSAPARHPRSSTNRSPPVSHVITSNLSKWPHQSQATADCLLESQATAGLLVICVLTTPFVEAIVPALAGTCRKRSVYCARASAPFSWFPTDTMYGIWAAIGSMFRMKTSPISPALYTVTSHPSETTSRDHKQLPGGCLRTHCPPTAVSKL